jgi:hypothetical protein
MPGIEGGISLASLNAIHWYLLALLLLVLLTFWGLSRCKGKIKKKSGSPITPEDAVHRLKKCKEILPVECTETLHSAGATHIRLVMDVWHQLAPGIREQLIDFWENEGYIQYWINALGSKSESEQVTAVDFLIKIKDKRTITPLINALSNPDKYVPARVGEVLMSFGEEAVEQMISCLPDLPEETKCMIISILGEIGNEKSLPALVKESAGPYAEVRTGVAAALGEIGNPGADDCLILLLKDPEWKVRANAAKALGKVGSSKAIPALKEVLDDEAWWVQTNAREALGRLGGREE